LRLNPRAGRLETGGARRPTSRGRLRQSVYGLRLPRGAGRSLDAWRRLVQPRPVYAVLAALHCQQYSTGRPPTRLWLSLRPRALSTVSPASGKLAAWAAACHRRFAGKLLDRPLKVRVALVTIHDHGRAKAGSSLWRSRCVPVGFSSRPAMHIAGTLRSCVGSRSRQTPGTSQKPTG